MDRSGKTLVKNIGLLTFAIMLMGAALVRCFFGVDTTDESMYIAESAAVSQGQIPYVTNWFHSSGYAVAAVPFIKLYRMVTGGYEGIFLYTRIAYTLIKAVILTWGFFVIRRLYSVRTAALFLMPVLLFAPHSISNFSYNTIPFLLELVAACYMMRLLKEKKTGDVRWVAVLVATATFLNPTHAVMAFWWFVVLVIFCSRHALEKKCVWQYVVTGVAIALAVCLLLSLLAGGIGVFIEGFATATKYNPYYYLDDRSPELHKRYAVDMLKGAVICLGICFLCWLLLFKMGKEKKRSLWALQIGTALFIIAGLIKHYQNISGFMRMLYGGLILLPLIVGVLRAESDRRLLFIWWFPGVLNLTISAVTACYGISHREYLLLFSVLTLTLQTEELRRKDAGSSAVPHIFPIVFAFALAGELYGYMYRDVPVWQCNTVVQEGIYKGIVTTSERADYLVILENYIHEVTASEDWVYAQQSDSSLYLMSDGKILAPTAWSSSVFWGLEHSGDVFVMKYFEFMEREPDIILYHYINVGPVVDIEKDDYPFCIFIRENYTEVEGNDELPKLKIYKRK